MTWNSRAITAIAARNAENIGYMGIVNHEYIKFYTSNGRENDESFLKKPRRGRRGKNSLIME